MVSLEIRCLCQDLIYVYKILSGLVDVNAEDFLVFACSSHKYKLLAGHSHVDIRKHFCAKRILLRCNSLALTALDFRSL
jgi:hypothetical protein